MADGLEEREMTGDFDFVDINPGLSGMAFAAEAEGGVCVGVLSMPRHRRDAYEAFHGRGSSETANGDFSLILASLPFSMFVRNGGGDPAVGELVGVAASAARAAGNKVKAIVFRVPWRKASALGVSSGEYHAVVKAAFADRTWTVIDWESPDGADLFLTVVSREHWNSAYPVDAAHLGRAATLTAVGSPQEMLLGLGYPANFALHNSSLPVKSLEGAVSVHNARAAVSGALKAVR